MTHTTIETALLEQLVGALEGIKRAWMNEVESSCNATRDVDRAITKGRAALANAEPAGWQPIATAPKDGSTVYASGINYNTPSRGRHFCLAHFHEGMWYETSDWNSSSTLEYLDIWAPLPAAPKEQP